MELRPSRVTGLRGGNALSILFPLLTLIIAGCMAPPSASTPSTAAGSGLLEPSSFSDEASRDLIRKTRELLDLKARDYLVGPDDLLEVSVFEWEFSEQTRTLELRVGETGTITLPVVGPVAVAGHTIQDVQATIVAQLASHNILQNPRVAVSVKEYRSRRIGVVGAVNVPGVYAIHQNVSTLLDVLTLAGGPNDTAGEVVYVLRQGSTTAAAPRIAVDLGALFVQGDATQNPVLQGGDVIYVPKAPLIFVYGNVRQPGGFALQRPTQILDAVALAGGLGSRADKSGCKLIRRRPDGAQTITTLDLGRIERGTDANPYLRGGDVLNVPQSSAKTVLGEMWDVVQGIFTFTYRLDSGN
ncbi:MAG: polysaccharide export protein [Lentisphaerae bacterium]|nr:polysaccharide export protein [Lentisphaerota bacterium]